MLDCLALGIGEVSLIVVCVSLIIGVIAAKIIAVFKGKSGCSGDCGKCAGCSECKKRNKEK